MLTWSPGPRHYPRGPAAAHHRTPRQEAAALSPKSHRSATPRGRLGTAAHAALAHVAGPAGPRCRASRPPLQGQPAPVPGPACPRCRASQPPLQGQPAPVAGPAGPRCRASRPCVASRCSAPAAYEDGCSPLCCRRRHHCCCFYCISTCPLPGEIAAERMRSFVSCISTCPLPGEIAAGRMQSFVPTGIQFGSFTSSFPNQLCA